MQNDRFRFRAWDKTTNKMIYNLVIGTILKHPHNSNMTALYIYNTIPTFHILNNDLILMQSTGLKDSEGKLIYEGDVIQVTTWRNESVLLEIKWNDKLAGYEGLKYLDVWATKIIGNVYENSELLTKEVWSDESNRRKGQTKKTMERR